jgi:hypothetical protein
MLRVMQFAADKHRERGEGGVISDWYRKELLPQARLRFDDLLRDLEKLRAKEWSPVDFFPLTGAHSGISELRFTADKKEYRPLGLLLPPADIGGANLDVLVLLVGAYKKMGLWTPHGARDTAVGRRKLVLADRKLLYDYHY